MDENVWLWWYLTPNRRTKPAAAQKPPSSLTSFHLAIIESKIGHFKDANKGKKKHLSIDFQSNKKKKHSINLFINLIILFVQKKI